MDVQLVSSRIDSVTAYRKGARIVRVGEVKAEGGAFPTQIRLVNLPLALDDSTLKVRLTGVNSSGIPIASDLRVSLEAPPADPELPPAEDPALRAARIECLKIADRVEQNRIELARLDRISIPRRHVDSETKSLPPVPTESRLKLLDLRKERLEALLKEKDWLQLMQMDAERKLQDIQSRLARESSARQTKDHELRKTVTISLRSSGAAGATAESAQLALEYLVPGARWAPAYTFRFAKDYSTTELSMRALVCQKTGEDWAGAKLVLSTANAQAWTELPELNSLRIGRKQDHAPRRGWRPPPTGVEELYGDYDRYAREQLRAAKTAIHMTGPASGGVPAPMQKKEVVSETVGEFVLDDSEKIRGLDAQSPYAAAALPAPPVLQSLMASDLSLAASEGKIESSRRTISAGSPAPMSKSRARAAPAAAPPSPPGSSPKASETRLDFGGGGGMTNDDEVGELRPKDQLLNFGRLRMPAPDASGRGKLELIQEDALYAEILAQAKVEFTLNIKAAVFQSIQRARAVEQFSPPHRCRFPESVDGFDYAYAAPTPTPVDIPSDGEFHSIPLVNENAESRSSFTCVPRESLDVYRFVEITNPLSAPLLDGPADIHVGGDFLMTSPLTTVPPSGRIRLGLGVEQAIKVARNTTYAEEAAGLIGGSLDLKHEIKIDVISHLPQPATIEIRERIPILKEEEDQAKLTVTSVTPDWQELKPELLGPEEQNLKGAYRWTIQAAPGKSQQLRATYVVQISAKNEISGGNRRE